MKLTQRTTPIHVEDQVYAAQIPAWSTLTVLPLSVGLFYFDSRSLLLR